MKNKIVAVLLAAITLPALAQEGPTFRLTEHAFNAGGHPEAGTVMTSVSFRVSLDSLGETVVKTGLSGPSFRLDASFVSAYPPPGEVFGLWFSDHETLHWDPEKSTGDYNLYRGPLSDLSGMGYGTCREQDIVGSGTADPDVPSSGGGFFYLVTAENRLNEEGIKGFDSDGAARGNPSPCP